MKDLEFVVTFGTVLRNMHRWAAHAMVFVVFLHMCRVFFTGAYTALVGEQLKYLLLGGHVIGPGALLRFYVLHCVILPVAIFLVVAVHVWRVCRDGGLAVPAEPAPVPVEEGPAGAFPPSTRSYGLMALTDRPAVPVHYSALVGGVLVPGFLLLALLLVPYLDPKQRGVGLWFPRERRLANAVFAALAGAMVALTLIGMFFRGPNWRWIWPWTG